MTHYHSFLGVTVGVSVSLALCGFCLSVNGVLSVGLCLLAWLSVEEGGSPPKEVSLSVCLWACQSVGKCFCLREPAFLCSGGGVVRLCDLFVGLNVCEPVYLWVCLWAYLPLGIIYQAVCLSVRLSLLSGRVSMSPCLWGLSIYVSVGTVWLSVTFSVNSWKKMGLSLSSTIYVCVGHLWSCLLFYESSLSVRASVVDVESV